MDSSRAVVWDLDGVLVDSGDAHKAAWIAMAREWDVPYSADRDFPATFGRHNTDIITLLWGVTDPNIIQRMADSKEGYFRHGAAHLQATPGALDLVNALKTQGWKQAIGSSAPMKNIEAILQAIGLAGKMDAIASGDDVSKGKPDPEVFLKAFQKLGVNPAQGVVIEDAPTGVQAGKRSGAACVGLANSQHSSVLLQAGADLVVHSLTELSVDALEGLVGRGK